MKPTKFILTIAIILILATTAFSQYGFGRFGAGGVPGLTWDGDGIVFGDPADSVIFEIPISAEASFTFTTLIGTSFKVFDTDQDSIILNPEGFSKTNSKAAGVMAFQVKDGENSFNLFSVDSLANTIIGGDPVTGNNPFLYIYGYSTTHAGIKYGRINVSAQGNMVIWGENAGYLGAQGQSTYLFDNQGGAFIDDKRLRLGSDNDAILAYDETTIDGLLFGVPVTSKRGLAIIDAADISVDITSLIGTTSFPDVHFIDTDSDSKLKVGWIADDEPEITANRTLDIQSSGDVDLNIFGKSGAGENAILKVWGDESGTPTYFSIAVEAGGNVDMNAEGNVEFGGQLTQIGQWTNKIQQMLDQRWIAFGTASQGDFRMVWDDSAHASGYNEALLVGIADNNRGMIIGDAALLTGNGGNAYDITALISREYQASLALIDDDRDSYLQFYHSADDLPVIKAVKDLYLNAPNIHMGTATAGLADLGIGAADQPAIYVVDSGVNLNISTLAEAIDTSAFSIVFGAAGDPVLKLFKALGVGFSVTTSSGTMVLRSNTTEAMTFLAGSSTHKMTMDEGFELLTSGAGDHVLIEANTGGSAEVSIGVSGDVDILNLVATITYVPNAASNSGTSVADDAAITVTHNVMRMVGADAEAVLDTDPAVNDGTKDGQIVIIQGTADGNLVTIADNVNTQLAGGLSMTLGDGDILALMWDSNYSMWIELYRSDN